MKLHFVALKTSLGDIYQAYCKLQLSAQTFALPNFFHLVVLTNNDYVNEHIYS